MSESIPYTDEMIDAAWQEAIAANKSFDRSKSAKTRLDRVLEVASFAISGIGIEDNVFTDLENNLTEAQTDFERHTSTASPLMKAPDSPFRLSVAQMDGSVIVRAAQEQAPRTLESIIDQASPVCDYDELCRFAELRGYSEGMGGRSYYLLARQGQEVKIDDISSYIPPADPSVEDFGQLRTIAYEIEGKRKLALDKAAILYNVCKWIDTKPDIRNLGVTVISFLADYCNHAFPELEELLPVTRPPKPKATAAAETARLRELEPRELLLDNINLYTEGELEVVTDRSLRRHALSLGYTTFNAPQYSRLFQAMKRRMAADDHPREGFSVPHRINDWLVYTGEYGVGTTWGIPPYAFREIINRFETSPGSRQYIECYTDLTRNVLRQYLAALESVIPDPSKTSTLK